MKTPVVFSPEQARAYQDLLIRARNILGKKQKDIAEEAGVGTTTVSQVESTPNNGVNFVTFCRLLQTYGVSPNEVAAALGFIPGHEQNRGEMDDLLDLYAQIPKEKRGLVLDLMRGLK
jgi:transcriptional regulator with XRE-family HTH domain